MKKHTATSNSVQSLAGAALLALGLGVAVLAAQATHAQTCPFDDGNSSLAVEGVVLTRYALGITGAPLVANTGINVADEPTVVAAINCPSCGLNITGNPTMTVADATIISRKLAGFSGNDLTNGVALGSGTRNTPAAVQSFLLAGCGATGGTVTSVTAGTGLAGGPITTTGALSLANGYQLPQSCANGQVPKSNGAGGWACAADLTGTSGGSGTVTSIATGAGLTGGPITGAGTIGLAASQLLPTTTCADSQTLIWNSVSSNWICAGWQPPGAGLPTCLTGQVLRFGASGALSCGTLPNTITTITPVGALASSATSIAVPSDGRPVLAYAEGNSGATKLKVAKCADVNCSGSTISVVDSASGFYDSPSIAISTDGLPVISYYDITAADLKVTKCGNADCSNGNSTVIVDALGNTGEFSSIFVPADGLPVISYYSGAATSLKVAKCGTVNCSSGNSVSTIVTGNPGLFSAITVPADGLPIIAHINNTTNKLAVVKCGNAGCSSGNTLTTVDAVTLAFDRLAIAVSADGFPVISYLEVLAGLGRLRVAKCGNAGCSSGNTLVTVDATSSTGLASSIAVPADGRPVISYYDVTALDLRLAKCGNAACSSGNTFTTLDSAGNVGEYTSIKVPADGLPVISYIDVTNSQLKVVKCSNSACLKP